VILSETVKERLDMGAKMGADFLINPLKEDFTERFCSIPMEWEPPLCRGHRVAHLVYPTVEQAIWRGKNESAAPW